MSANLMKNKYLLLLKRNFFLNLLLNIDRHNRACDRRKTLLNGHHRHHYQDVATTFTDFNSFTTFSKTVFAIF